ncbi:AfsR/SARP family transcriptional regulator [Umezawaea tangerina]|uniref:DNA-binding SARP family transcriptional activator n=1 Tax=Umezawaea tangerina TaxID=84725 RepID=A0A2T0T443_9PSEU|nr:BTAD domain-containing putative transcriptional regulator [Umezawaea tangerina]PRY40399.1 DNA-binding SARP family transcriptional activator [Umezawaea tangerina]
MSWSFGVLGPLEVRCGDQGLLIAAPQQRRLLTTLLLSAGQEVSVETLLAVLWEDEPPASGRKVVQVYVSQLRRLLASDGGVVLTGSRQGYRLDIPPEALDLHGFRDLVRRATATADPVAAGALLREALGLWRGDAVPDLRHTGRGGRLGAALEEERLSAVEYRVDADLRAGRHRDLVPELTALVADEPLRERLRGQLMLALHHSGRQAEALAVFGEGQRLLAEELGLDPGQELRALHAAVLAGDAPPAPEAVAEERFAPRELPVNPAVFMNRDREREMLLDLLARADREPVVGAVHGPGGRGKSALVLRVAHLAAGLFPDGQLYVDLQGSTPGREPLDATHVLQRFLRALGSPPLAVPSQPAEAAALYRSLLADRRVLVVLDNAVDASQVIPLLPAGPGTAVLVTSRRMLATVDGLHLVLDPLAENEAVGLLGAVTGLVTDETSRRAAADVARNCGYLPLALRIAAARLRSRPDWTLASLAHRLDDERHRLDELRFDDLAVRSSVRLSYDELLRDGSARGRAAAHAFRLLGLLALPTLRLPVAAALLGLDQTEAERAIDPLVDAGLVEAETSGQYRMHDLLRLFAIEEAEREEPAGERSAAITRALRYYCRTLDAVQTTLRPLDVVHSSAAGPPEPHGGIEECLAWMADETSNLLVAAAHGAARPETALPALEIARMLQEHLWKQDQHAEIDETGRIAVIASKHGLDANAEHLALVVRAVADRGAGRYTQARGRFHRALALCEADGDEVGRARVLVSLGGLLTNYMGQAVEAVPHLEEALEILRAHGAPGTTVGTLHVLARAHHLAGRTGTALSLAGHALSLALANDAPHSIAICLADLGLLYGDLGDLDRALAHLDECMARAREVGNREDEWTTLLSRSEVHLRRGDVDAALADARRSLTMTSQLGSAYGRAAGHRQVARALLATGHHAEAEVHRTASRTLFDGADVRLPVFFESFLGYLDPVLVD